MFNLLVKGGGWGSRQDSISLSRLFEFTSTEVEQKFRREGGVDFGELIKWPALIMAEDNYPEDPIVRVGWITNARATSVDVSLTYHHDDNIQPLRNSELKTLAPDLGIDGWEFSRTHWAVKEADLFHLLLVNAKPKRSIPKVFNISNPEDIDSKLVSVMMPFDSKFTPVHDAISNAVKKMGMNCLRADNIWENNAIIQDIVSLIDRAAVVVCDCTGRNPNVFYEIGIAHALGREVVLITQIDEDIPFDLRHLRYLKYLCNGEGLQELAKGLQGRLETLLK